MRYLAVILLALLVAGASAQSAKTIAPNDHYTITAFPLFGALVTPSDTVALSVPGAVRADADGAVTVVCVGNPIASPITLTMVAGEFVPCLVSYVFDTGTDGITLHVFY